MGEFSTVQLRVQTIAMLKELRKKEKASSYDDIISHLVRKKAAPKSMRGSLQKYFKSREEALKGLRDEHDRY
ncbi:MAG: hypothetical protein Q7T16_02665 [Candidatus Burarchaeum sp.]|nr:hypothetical protein [Candidatus Burarchaeum sp.]MDO8339536.1 hypothetical protein [Candidatus Burarchaeum sp.]